MGMTEESYFLLQILQKIYGKYEKPLPNDFQQELNELSQKDLPSHYTIDVDKVIDILWEENESSALHFGQYVDCYDEDMKSLRDNFNWEKYLQTFLQYMSIAIIHIRDHECLANRYRGFVDFLEHHRRKDTHIFSWKELNRVITPIVKDYEEVKKKKVAEDHKNNEPIRELILRTMDHVYKENSLHLPPELQTQLDEFPVGNRLFEAVKKAIPILLRDPELRYRVDEAEVPLTAWDALEGCVYRSKTAAQMKDGTNSALITYRSTLDEFIALRLDTSLNLLFEKINSAAEDIIAVHEVSNPNGKSTEAATGEGDEDQDMLDSNADNSDTQQLVDSSPDECKCSNFTCCMCFKKCRRT